MSPGGSLYVTYSKAVALNNPDYYCYVDRVRVYVISEDLRINPNYSGNYVGTGQSNYVKQVKAVQIILYNYDYLSLSDIDGICGPVTIAAIEDFQWDHWLTPDGIVGANTWRALCSGDELRYGQTTFGDGID